MRQILQIIGVAALCIGLVWLVMEGFNRQEVVECNQWKAQAAEFENFYLAGWQADQCEAHGITIEAPVHR